MQPSAIADRMCAVYGRRGGSGDAEDDAHFWDAFERERLCAHTFELRGTRGRMTRLRFNPCGQMLIFVLLLGAVVSFAVGACLPSFRMKSLGIVGKVLDLSGGEGIDAASWNRPFSVFSVTGFVGAQAKDGLSSQLGLKGMTSLFVFCAFVVPVLQTLTIAGLWACKLTLKGQKRLLMINEILSAWQYLEVYIIAIIVALLQMKTLTEVCTYLPTSYLHARAISYAV